jgi:hypothetical protein
VIRARACAPTGFSFIQLEQPQAVVDAIQRVVVEVRDSAAR